MDKQNQSTTNQIISDATGVDVKTVNTVINALETEIRTKTAAGDHVQLYGFGIFKPKVLSARTVTLKGTQYDVPGHLSISFDHSDTSIDKMNA